MHSSNLIIIKMLYLVLSIQLDSVILRAIQIYENSLVMPKILFLWMFVCGCKTLSFKVSISDQRIFEDGGSHFPSSQLNQTETAHNLMGIIPIILPAQLIQSCSRLLFIPITSDISLMLGWYNEPHV